MRKMNANWQLLILCLATIVCTISPTIRLTAQEAPPATPSEQPSETKLHEQTIYIPYSKLREVFEKEGRGVFLPYEKFQELWNAAREKTTAPAANNIPVAALIVEAENEATISKDVVRVKARLTIELLKQGWNQVPLRLNDAAIQSAKIDNETARIVANAEGGYSLLVENKDKEPKQVQLDLEYVRAFTKAPGQNSVSFQSPQAPVNRWRIRIPESGIKVNIQPMIAATEAPQEADPAPEQTPEETVLLAFVGAAPEVRIDWTPKSEGAAGMAVLANVRSEQEVLIDDGTMRTRATYFYDVSRAELSKLTFVIPADQKIVNVFDPNVKRWEVTAQGDSQRLDVELFEAVRNSQSLTLELEKFIDTAQRQEIIVPTVAASDVGRQQGVIVVRVASTMRAEVAQRVGLAQIDVNELPPAFAGQAWSFAYRYSTLPYQLSVNVEKIEPRISVEHLVEAYLEPQQSTIDMLAIYQIDQAGVFQLESNVPTGYDIRQVRGVEVAGAAAVAVDAFHLSEDKTKILISLSRKAMGRVALFVELQKRIDDPNLMTPTAVASTIALAIPQIVNEDLERSTGRLLVYTPESLRATAVKSDGLRSISFTDAVQGLQSMRENRFPAARETFAFAFADQPVDLQLSVERRKPFISVRQLLVVRTESGVTKFDAKFFYDIRYSGVKTLRIDVPTEIAGEVRNQSNLLRETPITPAPTDVPAGYTAWSFTGDTELIGETMVHLTWERKIEELAVGKSSTFSIPVLKPAGTDRAWGQVAITKAETLDVQPAEDVTGLRAIDPQHDMMPGAAITNASRAFEFHDDWKLNLVATRYQLEEVKRTSIERAWLRMVTTRSGQISVQALYRLKSARQRLAVQLPKQASFDSQPLRINGIPVALERGEQDTLFLPLIGHDPSESIVMELRYSLDSDADGLLHPVFPEDPAVQKVFLSVYIPKERKLIAWDGPWTDEWTWYLTRNWDGQVTPTMNDGQLFQWVQQGVNVAESPSFQIDGQTYLFSTLRPEPPPNGLLRLRTMSDKVFTTLCLGIVVLFGLMLLFRSLKTQLALAALLLSILLVCGAFAPTLARQAMNAPTLYGLAIVLVLWIVRMIGWTLPTMAKNKSFAWKDFVPSKKTMIQTAALPAGSASPPNVEVSSDTKEGGKGDE
jgi:hypothetical protein